MGHPSGGRGMAYLPSGGDRVKLLMVQDGPPPPLNRIRDACENINFPRTTYVVSKKV